MATPLHGRTVTYSLLGCYPAVTFFQSSFCNSQGWYQSLGICELYLVSHLEGLVSPLISKQVYVPALIAMAIPLLIAVLLGKIICSWVCPISFLAEMLAAISRRIQQKPCSATGWCWPGDRFGLP